MKTVFKMTVLLLLYCAGVFAQGPDCEQQFTLTATSLTSTPLNNVQIGCKNWIVVYQVSGFSAVSLTFQAATGSETPGTWGTYGGTTVTGSNPLTSATGDSATFQGYAGWVRVTGALTGTGFVRGTIQGWRQGYSAKVNSGGVATITAGPGIDTTVVGTDVLVEIDDSVVPIKGDCPGMSSPATPTANYGVGDTCQNATVGVSYTCITVAVGGCDLWSSGGGSGAPIDAKYITQTADATLSAEQALGDLTTGCLGSTATTGVVAARTLTGTANQITVTNGNCSGTPTFSIPTNPIFSLTALTGTLGATNFPALTGDVTTTAGALATTIANLAVTNAKIAASTIDLTAKVTGILPTANGGTGIAFFAAAGPTTARVYTFPDAAATIARTDAAQTFTGLQTFDALTQTGIYTNSTAGALSAPSWKMTGTPVTGGTGTTTKPMALIETAGATSAAWSTSGTMFGVNSPGGFGGNILDLMANGTSRFRVDSTGAGTFGGGVATSAVQISTAGGTLVWNSRGRLNPTADGVLALQDAATTSFGRLQFGGTTSSFPSLKRSTTELVFRLADDSADSAFTASSASFSNLAASTGTPDSMCLNTNLVTRNAALTCTVSSRDYKTSIGDFAADAFALLMELRPVEFAYNDHPDRLRYGLIAEEVAAVNPRLADGYDVQGVARSLDQNAILALLIKVVQEQQAEIVALKAR